MACFCEAIHSVICVSVFADMSGSPVLRTLGKIGPMTKPPKTTTDETGVTRITEPS